MALTWTKFKTEFLNHADENDVDIDIESEDWLEDILPDLKIFWQKGDDVETAFEKLF